MQKRCLILLVKELIVKMKNKKINKCRFCGNGSITKCIDLGDQYLSSIFPNNLSYKKELKRQPLSLVLCKKNKNSCGLLR